MGERLITTLGGAERDSITPPEGSVVVAHDLSPADTAQLGRYKVAGIVTEEGGQTSHTAIIARALEIPAVVGVDNLLSAVDTGDLVIVDGVHGLVHVRPNQAQLDALAVEVERYDAFNAQGPQGARAPGPDRRRRDHPPAGQPRARRGDSTWPAATAPRVSACTGPSSCS